MSTPTFQSKVPFSLYIQLVVWCAVICWYSTKFPWGLIAIVPTILIASGTTPTFLLKDDQLSIRTFFNLRTKTTVPLSAITEVHLIRGPRAPLQLTFRIPGTARKATLILHALVQRMPASELKAVIDYLGSKGIPVKIQKGLELKQENGSSPDQEF